MTADCDSYREHLAASYPKLGHAIWEPTSVYVGDVGCIRDGKFLCLFNALHLEGHPSNIRFGVPESHEPLVPRVANHIDKGILKHSHYCSARIIVSSEPEFMAQGPDEPEKVTFSNRSRRGGAVLYLPVDASRWDTLARRDFGQWMVKNIDCWFAFARQLGLGIEQMEDIVLVTGCHRAKSWANVAFLEGHTDAQASFGVEVVRDPAITIKWQFFPSRTRGAMCSWGPEGKNLPEDQCIFIRGFRVVRRLGILPKQLRGAAGPNPNPDRDDDDDEQHVELVSIPNSTEPRDPLHVLSEYMINQSPYCDMTLIHDDDLARIDGTWDNIGLAAFHPDTMMHYLRVSKPEIVQHVVVCQPSTSANCAEVGNKAYTVAMFSKEFQEWDSLSTHRNNSIWCTEAHSAVTLAFVMSLIWASWFQFFALTLPLVNLNSTSSQVLLYDPVVLIFAMCGATMMGLIPLSTTRMLNPLTMLKVVGQRRYRRMFPIMLAAILGSTIHVLFLVIFYAKDKISGQYPPIVCIFFGNAGAGILQGCIVKAEMIPDATDTDACHKPAFTASRFVPMLLIIQLSILSFVLSLGIMMYKTLGGVGQASLGLIINMFMTATTALVSIVAMESVLWFLDKLLRSYSGPAQATASMVWRGVWRFLQSVWGFSRRVKVSFDSRNDIRYNPIDARRGSLASPTNADRGRWYRRKTEQRPLPVQDGMRAGNGS